MRTPPLPYAEKSVTGLILAGGRATRMQNRDKGLVKLDDKSLVDHVVQKLVPQVSTLIINANRHSEDYAKLGFPVYADSHPNEYMGPLAGLEVGLIHCTTPYLVTAPCDSPFLPMDLVQRLMDSLQQQQADVAVACTVPLDHPQDQPVFCLLKTTLLKHIQEYLARGGRRMDGWYGDLVITRVHFENEAAFRNINTLEELKKCEVTR